MLKKFLLPVFIVIGGLLVLITANQFYDSDLTPDQSSALFGGQIELGFPQAGYLLTKNNSGGTFLCGFGVISEKIGITAAHCFDSGNEHYAGIGEFTSNVGQLNPVIRFNQNLNWDKVTSIGDFAVFEVRDTFKVQNPAVISQPDLNCNYRVVAYGRNEKEERISTKSRDRKSARVCIREIDNTVLTVIGEESGLCLGDSGSPIFEDGTNRVVGVVSAVRSNNNSASPCFIQNVGIAVRADLNLSLITGTTNLTPEDLQSIPVTVNLSEQPTNFFASLNLDQELLIPGLLVFILLLFILIGYRLAKRK